MSEVQNISTQNLAKRDGNPENVAVCTAIGKNHLSYARTLTKSLQAQNPGIKVHVLLVGRVDGDFDPANEPFTLTQVEELTNIPYMKQFLFKYNVTELSTAVKPFFFLHLMEKYDLSKLIFFDPDILNLHPIDDLWKMLDRASIVLTPHICAPYEQDGRHPDELVINRSGIFNLGFIAMANTENCRKFLKWWARQLYDFCAMDLDKGMHVDQKWVNFAPAFMDDVHILRDPAYNMAYWNLHERYAGFELDGNGKPFVYGRPLIFFHFSGFDATNIEQVSKHQNRFRMSDVQRLRPLFERYRSLVNSNGYDQTIHWPFTFDSFDNGTRIPDMAKKFYYQMWLKNKALAFGDPFSTKEANSFYHWLNFPSGPQASADGRIITNLMHIVHDNRIDLCVKFPDVLGRDKSAYWEWFVTEGAQVHKIDKFFIPEDTRTERQYIQHGVPLGVNVSGYLQGEFGVAEESRSAARALEAVHVPYVMNNYVTQYHRNEDKTYIEFKKENPFPINLIHVNADQADEFVRTMGVKYLQNKYNICFWAWELEKFPERWFSSFKYYQEIWVRSGFVQDSISKVSPIPVTKITHAMDLDELDKIQPDRTKFNIPKDRFTFLFSFDFLSVFERKNPLALIQAFRQAFSPSDPVTLVIKTINSKYAREKKALIESAVAGLNVQFIDGHLTRADMLTLMKTCDSFVSLHRSEGFGIGLAQSMYLGKPVIATAYSGNMDFMNINNSFLVEYNLVELEENYGAYDKGNVWADPSVEHAASLMKIVAEDRSRVEKKTRQAVNDIRAYMSPEAVGAEMVKRFQCIMGEPVTMSAGSVPAHTARKVKRSPEEVLNLLLSADDLIQALQQHEEDLTPELLVVVRSNAAAARAEGETDLAEGLDNLAAYIGRHTSQ